MAVSSDGNTAVVGDPDPNSYSEGYAYIFTRSGEVWSQQGELTGKPRFVGTEWGELVALSGDGNTALLSGRLTSDPLSLQKRAESKWTPAVAQIPVEAQVPRLPCCTALHASLTKLAISDDGKTILVGISRDTYVLNATGEPALEAGSFVLAYTWSGSTWQEQTLAPTGAIGESEFGSTIALSADGDTALIGGGGDHGGVGAAWVFTRSGTTWTQHDGKLTANNEIGAGEFGSSVALSADGHKALIGGPDDNAGAGAAWMFTRSGESFTQQPSKLTANEGGAGFGVRVRLSGEGNEAVIAGAGGFWTFGPEPEVGPRRHRR